MALKRIDLMFESEAEVQAVLNVTRNLNAYKQPYAQHTVSVLTEGNVEAVLKQMIDAIDLLGL
jgi:hypothetical protein